MSIHTVTSQVGSNPITIETGKLAKLADGSVTVRCGDTVVLVRRATVSLQKGETLSLPMHLAASVGTPSVSVFSRHAKPGIWFPFGTQNRVFYPGLAWLGGNAPVFRDVSGETNIALIPVAPVFDACDSLLRREIPGESTLPQAAYGS